MQSRIYLTGKAKIFIGQKLQPGVQTDSIIELEGCAILVDTDRNEIVIDTSGNLPTVWPFHAEVK